MKKLYPYLFVLGLLGGVAAAYAIRNWDPHRDIPQVTLANLNENETRWYAEGILDYDAVVSVSFSAEQRRYEISVRGGLLSQARTARFDESTGEWGPFSPGSLEDAGFYTMQGLFATVRSALFNDEVVREVLRLEVDPELSYPRRLVLGQIIDEGAPMEETLVLIEVLSFEQK